MAKERAPRRRLGPREGQARRRNCGFCQNKIEDVDYKDLNQLRRFISERGKIRSRRITGACRRHQNQVSIAVKRAREMALLPYVSDRPERSDRPDRSDRSERSDRNERS